VVTSGFVPYPLACLTLTVGPGEDWSGEDHDPCVVVFRCDATKSDGVEEVLGYLYVYWEFSTGVLSQPEKEGGAVRLGQIPEVPATVFSP